MSGSAEKTQHQAREMSPLRGDLLVAALPPSTLIFFGALQIFFHNAREFPWFILPVMVTLALLSIAVTIILFALLQSARSMNALLHKGLTVLITTVGVLLWVQGNFLVRQYGIFDGREIDWSRFARYANIDFALWGGGIMLMLALLRWTYSHAPRVAQLVLLIQIVSTVVMAFGYEAPEFIRYEEDASRKFVFSQNSNVIVLVLDTFATDFFNEAVLPFPRFTNALDGFTYYRDTMSEFPTTYPVVSAILTGKKFMNQKPFHDFLKEAFLSKGSLPLRLKQSGYDVYLPHSFYTYATPETSSSVRMATVPLAYEPEKLRSLLLAAVFRYAPHHMKQSVFLQFQDGLSSAHNDSHREGEGAPADELPADLAFLSEYERTIRTDNALSGTLKYYHLLGMHPPYRINENLEREELPLTRAGASSAARGNMKLVERFLQALKEQGVYDNSLILILGDHGSLRPEQPLGYSYGDMTSLNPLLLIKRPGEHGSLRIEDKPATHADLPLTVLDALAMNTAGMSGVSLFQNTTEHNAVRHYYSYDWWVEGGWDKDYLPDMVQYVINGSSFDVNHWVLTGDVFTPGAVVHREDPLDGPPLYAIDDSIYFGKLSSRKSYLLDGWAPPGVMELYPVAAQAHLLLHIQEVPTEYLLFDAWVSPLSLQRPQLMILRINGKRTGQWTINEHRQEVSALVHQSFLKENADNVLTFEFPDAYEATSQGISPNAPHTGKVSVVLHDMKLARSDI